jgi:hypothetical protein
VACKKGITPKVKVIVLCLSEYMYPEKLAQIASLHDGLHVRLTFASNLRIEIFSHIPKVVLIITGRLPTAIFPFYAIKLGLVAGFTVCGTASRSTRSASPTTMSL